MPPLLPGMAGAPCAGMPPAPLVATCNAGTLGGERCQRACLSRNPGDEWRSGGGSASAPLAGEELDPPGGCSEGAEPACWDGAMAGRGALLATLKPPALVGSAVVTVGVRRAVCKGSGPSPRGDNSPPWVPKKGACGVPAPSSAASELGDPAPPAGRVNLSSNAEGTGPLPGDEATRATPSILPGTLLCPSRTERESADARGAAGITRP